MKYIFAVELLGLKQIPTTVVLQGTYRVEKAVGE